MTKQYRRNRDLYLYVPASVDDLRSAESKRRFKMRFINGTEIKPQCHPMTPPRDDFESLLCSCDESRSAKNILVVDDGAARGNMKIFRGNSQIPMGSTFDIPDDRNVFTLDPRSGFIIRGSVDVSKIYYKRNDYRYLIRSFEEIPLLDAVLTGCTSIDKYGCLYSINAMLRIAFDNIQRYGVLDPSAHVFVAINPWQYGSQYKPDEAFTAASHVLAIDFINRIPATGFYIESDTLPVEDVI